MRLGLLGMAALCALALPFAAYQGKPPSFAQRARSSVKVQTEAQAGNVAAGVVRHYHRA